MGRRKLYESSSERVKAWRNRHKGSVTIKLDRPLGMVCKKYWEQDGVSLEQGIRAYEKLKKMYRDVGVDRLRDENVGYLPNTELLDGIYSDYIEGTVFLSVLECPMCHKRFPWLENTCPRCGRKVEIVEMENGENGTFREKMCVL